MKNPKITYSQVGDNYDTKDPIKILAQTAAKKTGQNLLKHGFQEVSETRGESAYVWKQGNIHMASVIEGLGTKNLIADEMRKITGKTYYDIIGHDTVATIINDLISVGAKPLVLHMYLAIESNDWLQDKSRINDLIGGFASACDIAGASWGGGETPTLKGIIMPNTVELGGSAIGIIDNEKKLITDKKMQEGDRILLLRSNGINTNGLSLARAVSSKLDKGYATKLPGGTLYGDALLTRTNIYSKLIQDLLDNGIDIHYLSNITGHGLRKIMRAKQEFSYILEKIFEPQELFNFIQNHAGLSEKEMYETYNMGMDYAIFLPEQYIQKAQQIIKQNGFESIDAGCVKAGERQVIIKPKNITLEGETLQLKA
jgi:phosphoribosylformylglycinamidine cyclo-ligase